MQKTYRASGFFRRCIRDASKKTLDTYRTKEVEEEPDITATLAQNLRQAINSQKKYGVTFTAILVRHSGRGAAEKTLGADLAGILDIELVGAEHRKFFLAQAKKCGGYGEIAHSEIARLQRQCEAMRHITTDSYVMMYEANGIYLSDASSVEQSTKVMLNGPGSLQLRKVNYYKRLDGFFDDMFKTWLGDTVLGSKIGSAEDLKKFAKEIEAANALYIRAAQSFESSQASSRENGLA